VSALAAPFPVKKPCMPFAPPMEPAVAQLAIESPIIVTRTIIPKGLIRFFIKNLFFVFIRFIQANNHQDKQPSSWDFSEQDHYSIFISLIISTLPVTFTLPTNANSITTAITINIIIFFRFMVTSGGISPAIDIYFMTVPVT
jgi:hypothetical protein